MNRVAEEAKKRLEALGCVMAEGDTEILEAINNSIEEYIKAFCSVSSVPEGLFYAQRDCICGEFLLEKKSAGALNLNSISFERAVKSIQEGDVSIVYGDNSIDTDKKVDKLIEYFIYRLRKELLNYRCVKWN